MNELVIVKKGEITVSTDFIEKYKNFKKLQLEMELAEKEVKNQLKEALENAGKTNYIVNGFSAVIRKGTTRTSLNTKKFKEDYPELFEEYSQTSDVASSIVLTVE